MSDEKRDVGIRMQGFRPAPAGLDLRVYGRALVDSHSAYRGPGYDAH